MENKQKFVTHLSILHSFQQSLSLKRLHNHRKNISRILSVLNIIYLINLVSKLSIELLFYIEKILYDVLTIFFHYYIYY